MPVTKKKIKTKNNISIMNTKKILNRQKGGVPKILSKIGKLFKKKDKILNSQKLISKVLTNKHKQFIMEALDYTADEFNNINTVNDLVEIIKQKTEVESKKESNTSTYVFYRSNLKEYKKNITEKEGNKLDKELIDKDVELRTKYRKLCESLYPKPTWNEKNNNTCLEEIALFINIKILQEKNKILQHHILKSSFNNKSSTSKFHNLSHDSHSSTNSTTPSPILDINFTKKGPIRYRQPSHKKSSPKKIKSIPTVKSPNLSPLELSHVLPIPKSPQESPQESIPESPESPLVVIDLMAPQPEYKAKSKPEINQTHSQEHTYVDMTKGKGLNKFRQSSPKLSIPKSPEDIYVDMNNISPTSRNKLEDYDIIRNMIKEMQPFLVIKEPHTFNGSLELFTENNIENMYDIKHILNALTEYIEKLKEFFKNNQFKLPKEDFACLFQINNNDNFKKFYVNKEQLKDRDEENKLFDTLCEFLNLKDKYEQISKLIKYFTSSSSIQKNSNDKIVKERINIIKKTKINTISKNTTIAKNEEGKKNIRDVINAIFTVGKRSYINPTMLSLLNKTFTTKEELINFLYDLKNKKYSIENIYESMINETTGLSDELTKLIKKKVTYNDIDILSADRNAYTVKNALHMLFTDKSNELKNELIEKSKNNIKILIHILKKVLSEVKSLPSSQKRSQPQRPRLATPPKRPRLRQATPQQRPRLATPPKRPQLSQQQTSASSTSSEYFTPKSSISNISNIYTSVRTNKSNNKVYGDVHITRKASPYNIPSTFKSSIYTKLGVHNNYPGKRTKRLDKGTPPNSRQYSKFTRKGKSSKGNYGTFEPNVPITAQERHITKRFKPNQEGVYDSVPGRKHNYNAEAIYDLVHTLPISKKSSSRRRPQTVFHSTTRPI